ncbi:hypothetical protein F4Z99_08510 [Candidatus Poribacteria bacterium]|nr:hypothetical protein [Candidatus Poribacteria bacterium]
MNRCLYDLFLIREKRQHFAEGISIAFDMVRRRMPPGNPAIGILREHVLIGFFKSEFGSENVVVPEKGNQRSYDVILCDGELSIKTLTGDSGFKVLWTVDNEQVSNEIKSGYQPEHDIFLINIFWNRCMDSVFYIPLSAQHDVIDDIGRQKYLSSATGTNNRGISINKQAVTRLKMHSDTLSFAVDWRVKDVDYPDAWDEWIEFWSNRQ